MFCENSEETNSAGYLGEVCLVAFGAVAQQGSVLEPRSTAGDFSKRFIDKSIIIFNVSTFFYRKNHNIDVVFYFDVLVCFIFRKYSCFTSITV